MTVRREVVEEMTSSEMYVYLRQAGWNDAWKRAMRAELARREHRARERSQS